LDLWDALCYPRSQQNRTRNSDSALSAAIEGEEVNVQQWQFSQRLAECLDASACGCSTERMGQLQAYATLLEKADCWVLGKHVKSDDRK
jgi:hypothetical protein